MDLIIFDLDGTLIDSKLDLAHSVNATRAFMGMDPLTQDVISSYVGSGAPVLIRRALGPGASEEQFARALEYFLAYYNDHCLDYTKLYDGAQETIEALQSQGRKLAVLTNKPVRISNVILQGLGVRSSFFQVYGGNSFEEKKPSPVGIQALRAESGVAAERTLMVGDSSVDVKTARNAGVPSCGVLYGFQPETFESDPPDFLIREFRELQKVVLG
ncbi:MAG TPA: HAD-IA family hydrolase [Bryobacteraceae bacterium]|nr:HAD-IA family hydrolase [Bryobacteraceae bacterium]